MLTNFLSNKHNLFGLMVACYVIVITILHQHLTTPQVFVVLCVMSVSNILWHIWGMGRGIYQSEMRKGAWKEFYKYLEDKVEETNKKK